MLSSPTPPCSEQEHLQPEQVASSSSAIYISLYMGILRDMSIYIIYIYNNLYASKRTTYIFCLHFLSMMLVELVVIVQ